ncbi:MAG: AAA family ATPase [Bacteroidales bacterium]|jgi:predicted ATPase|nr:AAA family ATPase [Bacteroidales bacterium]
MKEIFVSNFGPIKEGFSDGMMPIFPVTIFCGDQGSGKSTIAKLISSFSWLEKALIRGDVKEKWISQYNRFVNSHCAYHNIQNYFQENTKLIFKGTKYKFIYESKKLTIEHLHNNEAYLMPQIMYVPAERNFMSVIEDAEKIKNLPHPLSTLLTEYEKAKKSIGNKISLPIDGYSFQYDKLNKVSWLHGDGFKLRLHEAASGFQSLVPLILVTRYLSNRISEKEENSHNKSSVELNARLEKRIRQLLLDENLNEDIRNSLISQLNTLYHNDCFWNIVEEPEQNLFPKSQKNILMELLNAFNSKNGNGLIITTHSPYIVNYLTLAIKANEIICEDDGVNKQLENIVPSKSRVSIDNIAIYEMENGMIKKLDHYMDIPSDENYLNISLRETDELFQELLEIEDLCHR